MRGTPPTLLALKMVRGVMNQGMRRSLEAGVERQEYSFLELPGGTSPLTA